jgi:hypothetical protein
MLVFNKAPFYEKGPFFIPAHCFPALKSTENKQNLPVGLKYGNFSMGDAGIEPATR